MRALPPSLATALALSAVPALLAAAPPTSTPAATPLAGTWRLSGLPGAKGRPPELGELRVDATGSYQWTENKQLAGLGALEARQPTSGARAGHDCWRFHRGKGDLYLFLDGDTLEVYDAASNLLIGKGVKAPAAKRR